MTALTPGPSPAAAGEGSGTWYAVTWTRYGVTYLIDCDSREIAAELSTRLAGQRGAVDIEIRTVEEKPMDVEMKERVKARIWERMYEEHAFGPLREAIGSRP